MSEDQAPIPWGQREFPVAEHTSRGAFQLSEGAVMFDLRPASADEVAMSVQIDEIHDQLARDLPKLQREMNELLIRVRRPALV